MSKLRSAGWQVPTELDPAYSFRVYDTRLDKPWLQGLLGEIPAPEPMFVVGGDFLTHPHLEDFVALNPLRLARWGPTEKNACHIVVPPRPHQAAWLTRAHQQVALEGAGAEFTVACIVSPQCLPLLLGLRCSAALAASD